MTNPFFDHPILNSPYEHPSRHWELNESGQPTQQVVESRRREMRERIAEAWLDHHLAYKGGTYPAQLMYQELADMACNKITNAAGAGQ